MRIVCQKCAAAYAIDDRVITPKGVRAQCPRCRHLQLVRREEPGEATAVTQPAAMPPPPPAPAAADPFSRLAPPPVPRSTTREDLDFLGVDASLSATLPAAPLPAAGTPPSGRGPPPPPAVAPLRPAPAAARPPARPASPPPPPAPTHACRECGLALGDPFDQALGVCDGCRTRAAQPELRLPRATPRPQPAAPLPAEALAPRVETLPEVLSLASPAAPPAPAAPVAPAPVAPPARTSAAHPAPASPARRRRGWVWAAVGGVTLALGAGAALWVLQQGDVLASAPATPPPPPPLPAVVQEAVARWRLSFVDLPGTAEEHRARGQERLAEDTRASLLQAEESFQKALVLSPRDDAALGGYLLAFALGRGATAEEALYREALALADAGLQRSGRAPGLLVARACLLLARGESEAHAEARQLAESALAAPEPRTRAEAHLVLARALMDSSVALALQHVEKAEALVPGLGRAALVRARAFEAQGEYRRALTLLQERLQKDPQQWEALAAMARIHRDLGEPDKARALYEGRAKEGAGELAVLRPLAVGLYQSVPARPREAAAALRKLLAARETYEDRDTVGLWVHLATAERLAGNAAAARKAAEEALALSPEEPTAHLQLLMLALQRRDAAAAATHLGKVSGPLEEPALAAFLEGRVRFVEGRFAEARVRFLEAVRLDARRVDAQLWAGAAAAAGGQPEEAFHLMQGALAMDPVRVGPPPSQARFFLAPGETLQGAEGHLLALARGTSTVPARLYEGLVRYHQGDEATAERLLRSVVDEDMQNPVAHALRALVALRQRNGAQALRSAAAADRNGRQLPLAQFAWGEVLASRGEEAEALRAFRLAHTLAPALSSPAVRLAEMEAATGARVAARERLMKLVGRDPSDVAAKRALYAIDTRG